MASERMLLIGGAGFVGSLLAAALLQDGHEVTVLDSYRQFSDPFKADYTAAMAYRSRLLAGARLVRGDACNPMDVLSAFDVSRPHRVVNLAAVARAPLNDELVTEAIQTTTMSTANAFQAAARLGVRRLLLVSSSYVYGDFQHVPCDEGHPTSPTTVYGAAKLCAEVIARALGVSLGVPYTIVRLIAVYGPGDLNGKLSAPNLREAVTTGCLPIVGARGEGTDYTYITDAVRGLKLALTTESAAGETLNISRSRARTVDDVVAVLGSLGHRVTAQPERVGRRPRRGALSIERARQVLAFEPQVDLEEGLPSCVAHGVAQRFPDACSASVAHPSSGRDDEPR